MHQNVNNDPQPAAEGKKTGERKKGGSEREREVKVKERRKEEGRLL